MPKPNRYIAVVPFRLHGIPCQIGVIHFDVQEPFRGSPHACWSDVDYYGYTECDFDILDRKGYHAKWLEAKGVDEDDVAEAVKNYFQQEAYNDY